MGSKAAEYIEGRLATENFEEGMKALFKVPKAATVQGEKKGAKGSSRKRRKKSDKD